VKNGCLDNVLKGYVISTKSTLCVIGESLLKIEAWGLLFDWESCKGVALLLWCDGDLICLRGGHRGRCVATLFGKRQDAAFDYGIIEGD
tara:strand:+ start:485 stop:751 length:267 start_codon:yes stop_codon:yes gene_type:complete